MLTSPNARPLREGRVSAGALRSVPGYEASAWYGVGALKNTPAEIIDKLNAAINAAVAQSAMKARLADLGGIVFAGSPADFGNFIAEETDKWGKVVKSAGIKPA